MVMLSLLGLAAPGVILADELPKESVLPLGSANKAIQTALEACKKDGYRMSVSVVDRADVLRALGRADGAGPHTVDSSRKKAYTAVSVRRPTSELSDLITKDPYVTKAS
ncbi:MAG TPA: heme-binding protein [Nitrospira sp.]|nr:heme-binding protein [Nitrospira sp.]